MEIIILLTVVNILYTEIYGISKIQCLEHNKKDSDLSWLNEDFYAIAFGSTIPSNTIPICTDPFLVLTTTNKHEE